MARTFNRAPLSVPTPSSNDVKDYFFTHTNWKGLSNDKNFLTVDQETFSSCKNVYLDSEGLLKSRPSMTKKKIVVNASGNTELTDILDVWNYGKVTVYKTDRFLTFVNTDFEESVQIDITDNIKLVLVENKIFVFEATSLRYYDIDDNTISTTEDCVSKYVYTPVTKIVTNGVITDLESPNELTTSYNIRYLFNNLTNNNYSILLGKEVTVRLNEDEYKLTFAIDNEFVLVNKISDLTFSYTNISISDAGNMIINKASGDSSFLIYYSTNGKVFKVIDTLNNAVSVPVISSDGRYICYPSTDDIYVCQVVSEDGESIYDYDWIALLSTEYKELHSNWKTNKLTFNHTTFIKMLSIDTFSAICTFKEGLYCIVNHIGDLKRYEMRYIDFEGTLGAPLKYFGKKIDISSGYGVYYPTDGNEFSFMYYKDNEGITNYTTALEMRLTLKIKYSSNGISLFGHITYYYNNYGESSKVKEFDYEVPILNYGVKVTIVDNIKFTVTKTDTEITIRFDEPGYVPVPVHFDPYYPFGASYNHFNEDYLSNIDMYSEKEKFIVLINSGGICVVDQTCDNGRVIHISKPWVDVYKPQYYGLATNKDVLYYAAPNRLHDTTLLLYTFERNPGQTSTYKLLETLNLGNLSHSVVSNEGGVLTEDKLYLSSSPIPLLFKSTPVYINHNTIYLSKNGYVYSNKTDDVIVINEFVQGDINYILPEDVEEIGNFYLSSGKTLYISAYPSDGEFKWYLPKINTEQFDYDISNIHPISATEMAIFLEDAVYYIQTSENGYLYYKSKIQVGCKKGASIITSYDGKYILFPSNRGLVALSYQDFVASTEQTLTYLSDSIYDTFKEFNTAPIQLFKYDFWIICFKKNHKHCLLFDIRNNSWWPIDIPYDLNKCIIQSDQLCLLCDNKLFELNKTSNNYYDYDGSNKSHIDWYIVSQKLHLNAPNYYKHISNITLTSVLDKADGLHLDLTLYNYRKRMHTSDIESFKFDVDSVRVYVKRLNYSKVNEFQYLLTSDLGEAADEEEVLNVPKYPLSLSSITVKYKISGQVR